MPLRVFAQNAGDEERVTRTFRCVSWETPVGEPLYVRSSGQLVPVSIHHAKRSSPVDYVGANPIVFYRKVEGEAGLAYEPVTQIYVDEKMTQPLFLFMPSDDSFRVIPIEDSFDVYPTGGYRFYNFTDKKLVMKFGEETMALDGKNSVVMGDPFEGNTEYPIMVVVREPDGIKPLYSNRWRHNDNFRYIILVSESNSNDVGSIKFRLLSDFPDSIE